MITLDTIRYSYIAKNLINTGTGYYLSINDPGIYNKILSSGMKDGKLLYNAALALEKQADLQLTEFRNTRSRACYKIYKLRLKESLNIMRKSWKNGCIFAGKDVLRIDERLSRAISGEYRLLDNIYNFLTLLLLCFIAGSLIPVFIYLFR